MQDRSTQSPKFSDAKELDEIQMRSLPTWVQNAGEVS